MDQNKNNQVLKLKKRERNKRVFRRILIMMVLLFAMALIVPSIAAAAPGDPVVPTGNAQFDELMNQTVKILVAINEFLQRLIWPVLLLIGGLLKNDILFSAGMEEMMLTIWRNIRNIVNILFVLILLGIAFYNVLGGGKEEYSIKTMLPKFVIALIAVNFSFMLVKVVVDGVSVVTTALFALPTTVQQQLGKEPGLEASDGTKAMLSGNFKQAVCEGMYGEGQNYKPPENDQTALCTPGSYDFTDAGKLFFSNYDSNNAAIVLAINMGAVQEIKTVKLKTATDAVRGLFLNALFSTVIYIVYATAFVVLLIILAVRMVVLWVTMVLSPLIVLAYIVPDSLKSSLGGADDLSQKFIKNAIAPIPIALVMSIGFIMIEAWKQARFPGPVGSQTAGLDLLTSGMSTLQDLIAAVAMVVVIWIGVFAAAKDTYADSLVQGVKGAVEGAGKFVISAPFKYLPLIPAKAGGEAYSVGTVLGGLQQLPNILEGKQREKQIDFLNKMGITTPEGLKKELDGAKNGQDWMKAAVRNGPNVSSDGQRQLGESLDKNRAWRNDVERVMKGPYKDNAGNTWDKKKVFEALKDGKLPEEVWKQFFEDLRQAFPGEYGKVSPAAAGAGAGAAGAAGAGAAGAAAATLTPAEQNGLSTEDKQKIEAANSAKPEEAQQKMKEAEEARKKAVEVDQMVTDAARQFRGISNPTADTLADAVKKQREALIQKLKDNNVENPDAAADKLMTGVVTEQYNRLSSQEEKDKFAQNPDMKNMISAPAAAPAPAATARPASPTGGGPAPRPAIGGSGKRGAGYVDPPSQPSGAPPNATKGATIHANYWTWTYDGAKWNAVKCDNPNAYG